MTEYLRDLEAHKPGEPMPPINLGPYDNPLLWNMLDPYGADRAHQRRPMSVSRTFMELHQVPIIYRDHCVHRYIVWHKCCKNLRPMTVGTAGCHEFEEAWTECRVFEKYRATLLKNRFMQLTKDYTAQDRTFFPNGAHCLNPARVWNMFNSYAASMRLSGWDENDPANPMMWREPNRALMRSEFQPTNWERSLITTHLAHKVLPPELAVEEMPSFPLPENKRPKSA